MKVSKKYKYLIILIQNEFSLITFCIETLQLFVKNSKIINIALQYKWVLNKGALATLYLTLINWQQLHGALYNVLSNWLDCGIIKVQAILMHRHPANMQIWWLRGHIRI